MAEFTRVQAEWQRYMKSLLSKRTSVLTFWFFKRLSLIVRVNVVLNRTVVVVAVVFWFLAKQQINLRRKLKKTRLKLKNLKDFRR